MIGVAQLAIGGLADRILDFALPPRCAGCGDDRRRSPQFLPGLLDSASSSSGRAGARPAGCRLQATDADTVRRVPGRCRRGSTGRAPRSPMTTLLASLAVRLKYGRKVALARTMARFMAPLIAARGADTLLVPVPLHRRRLWQRGLQPVGAGRPRSCPARLGLDSNATALQRVRPHSAAQRYEPATAPAGGCRSIQGARSAAFAGGLSFWSTTC